MLGSEGALGSAIIRELQKKSLTIIAVDKNQQSQFTAVKYFQADFARAEQVSELSNFLQNNLTDENIIISTVGKFGANYNSNEFAFDEMLETLQINLISIAKLCLELSRKSVTNKSKTRFVLVGSAAGSVGSRDLGYGISKAGLNGLVLSLSKTFAQKNITAIAVNPGIFTSKMSVSVDEKRQEFAISQTHLKRTGNIAEVVNTIIYAALEAPDLLTGSLLNINGGQYS